MYTTLLDLFNQQPIFFILLMIGLCFSFYIMSVLCNTMLKILYPKSIREQYKHTLDIIDKDKSFGQQSKKYNEGYIRASEVIRNGSDADILLAQARNNPYPDEWDKGWKDACKYHISKQKNLSAANRTGITPEDEELLNTQS